MAKAKKISRKQLLKEPDEFMTLTGQFIQFSRKYQKQINWGVGVLFVLILIGIGGQYISKNNEKKAFALYKNAMVKYNAAEKDTSPTDAYEAVKADFNLILSQYAGKHAGKIARVMFADISYKAGDADTAISLYQKALNDIGSESAFRNMILNGLGYAYEMKQDPDSAVRYFEMIRSGDGGVLKSNAVFNLARIYRLNGNDEKSLDYYRMLLSDYPESFYSGIAKEKVAG